MVIGFHKPYRVLCQFTPERPGQRTLAEFGFPAGVYPVGRLDMDSEGLLLLTDEAGFNHRFLDPRNAHPRRYWVQVEGDPTPDAIAKLAAGGLIIDGRRTRPCQVRRLDPAPDVPPRVPPVRFRLAVPTTWLELSLVEGINRQVRRMTAAAGHPTLRLIRTRIGAWDGGNLPQGAWRVLDQRELRQIHDRPGAHPPAQTRPPPPNDRAR